jgi:transposase
VFAFSVRFGRDHACMQRGELERHLKRGLSIAAIAALVERHPSTVAYWVKKHGLEANGSELHSRKGGIPRTQLAALVEEGLSTRQIGSRLSLSQGTVRYWLRRHGLKTHGARRPERRGERGQDRARRVMRCLRHGQTEFWLDSRGTYRCLRCRSEAVSRRRRRLKALLVDEAGGRCRLCGYDRCVAALHFHHLDGDTKVFGLAERGFTRSLDIARAEAAKCALLCSNCHAEVEAGIVEAAPR